MESSKPLSVSKIDDSTLELGFQSAASSDCVQDPPLPPQFDPVAEIVDTNLLHDHLQSLELKDTDEKQNLGSESNGHDSQNLGLKETHDTQNLHLEEETHEPQNQSFDVKETALESQGLDPKETTHDEVLEKTQNVDLEETHHEGRQTGENQEAVKYSNEEENGEGHEELENGNEGDKVGSDGEVHGDGDVLKNGDSESSNKGHPYPLRPDAEDCAYYMKTGTCKFGSSCKFNHPLRRRSSQAPKEKVMERGDELAERPGQTECKYYMRTGGCKFGKACRYNHPKGKNSVPPILELNFLGLPIRMGERECPYYMRTGSCKYGSNCRFNHPDPTSTGGSDPSEHGNGGSVSLKGPPPSSITSWASPKTLKETPPFLPMMFQPTQGVPSQTPEWNGYQAPLYPPPERSMRSSPAYGMGLTTETSVYTHHQQQQVLLDEFPERHGQPECSYYLKTGDCKFKSNCKYHHPKTQIMRSPPCSLSDKGLPLRPDQNICTHYSRYGICKFGPACKFDHPVHYHGSAFDEPPRMGGSGSEGAIQQHV